MTTALSHPDYGFCFVGRQHRLALGWKEHFVDLHRAVTGHILKMIGGLTQ
jgi:hypothetical protein